jgi:WD40 repeat protein
LNLTRHLGSPRSISFSPDGKLIAMGGSGQDRYAVQVWDLASQKPIYKWEIDKEDQTGDVFAVTFAPNGRAVVACSSFRGNFYNFLHCWELKEGNRLWRVEGPPGTCSLQLTPDGKRLYVAGAREAVWLINMSDGAQLDAPEMKGRCLALLDGGKMLAVSQGADKSVRLLATATGALVHKFLGHHTDVTCLSATADGKTLASASSDGTILLWDVQKGQRLREFPGHDYKVLSIAYAPDGKTLATYGGDFTVRIWDAKTGEELRCVQVGSCRDAVASFLHFSSSQQSLVYSPEGRVLACRDPDGIVYLLDPATGRELNRLKADQGQARCLAFSTDGTTLAAGNSRGLVQLWDPKTGREVGRLEFPENRIGRRFVEILCVVFSPDGKSLVASCNDGVLRLWDVKEKALRAKHSCWAEALAFTRDGFWLAGADFGRRKAPPVIRFLEVGTGLESRQLKIPEALVGEVPMSIAVSPDGMTLAVFGAGQVVAWYELQTNREICQFAKHDREVNCVAFSPKGRYMASGSNDATVLVWDLLEAIRDPKNANRVLDKERGEELWRALADSDPAKAYPALAELAIVPGEAISLVRQRLGPSTGLGKSIAQLLADLDDDAFAVRETAARELVRRGSMALDPVKKALEQPPSAEARKHLEDVVSALRQGALDAGDLRQLRVVQLLERLGSKEAKELLERLADGPAEATVTRAAKASLARLR